MRVSALRRRHSGCGEIPRCGTENVTQTTAAVSCGDLETYIEGSGVTAAKKREELGREVKAR